MAQRSMGAGMLSQLVNLFILISVLAVVFSKTKQGLHDNIAGTYVVSIE
ncbi:MAG: hypothetical protein KDC92_07415 [Bacteroidetes bacterium]|nr:hypothetical protein [Bacteroidota bacterium]